MRCKTLIVVMLRKTKTRTKGVTDELARSESKVFSVHLHIRVPAVGK